MKVIHSFPLWLPKTQTWMYNQIIHLPPHIENHVVCERCQNMDQFSLPNIHCLFEVNRARYYWEKLILRLGLRQHTEFLVDIAKDQQGSVLHSHFGVIGWNNLCAAEKAGLRHVVTFYGQDVSRYPRQDNRWYDRYRELFESADLFLCEGPHMARCLVDLGCPDAKVRVHHLGIPVRRIAYRPRHWNPDTPLRVLMAATFTAKKGIPDGLEALGRLQKRVPVEISIIGDARDDAESQAERRRILDILDRHHLQSSTRLLGYQTYEVFFDEAYKHHVFLSPSITAPDGDTEGGAPVSLIEMAATGMPIVSTRHCDIPEVILENETGLLADEGDPEGLCQLMTQLVEHPERWSPMAAAGRKHVEAVYDATVQGTLLGQHYESLMKSER